MAKSSYAPPADIIKNPRTKEDAMRSAAQKSLEDNTQKSISDEYKDTPQDTNPVLFGIGAVADRAKKYLSGESDKKASARKQAQDELDSLDSSRYKKGGMVRGAGCATKGHGKIRMH